MKILQLNTVVNSGSTGRIAEEIGRVALNRRHESYIAFGRGNRPSKSQLIRVGNKAEMYWHGLSSLLYDGHGLASRKGTKELIKQIEIIQPDAIGLHNIHGYYLNYPLFFDFLKEKQIPVLWTFHDCWPFTGHCTYFEKTQCEKWKSTCDNCPQISHYPKSWVDNSKRNFLLKKAYFTGLYNLTIITPSHWLKQLVKASFLQDYPVEVIHNGIDLATFRPIETDSVTKPFVLGVASTWDERKGLKDFIALRDLLINSLDIVLIGLSAKQVNALPSGIRGIERTENLEALVEWYSKAVVFVNPTYIDNFPTTNLEALACGTPVVTYDTGGSPESINEFTGRIVNKGDLQSLVNEIMYFISLDQNLLRERCRAHVKKSFDKKDRFDDYIDLYESVVTKK